MVLSAGQSGLDRLGDVKSHPVIADAVHQIRVRTHVNADGTASSLGPVVHAVVGGGVCGSGPILEHWTNGDGFTLDRTVFSEQGELSVGHPCTGGLGNLAQGDSNQRGCLVSRRGLAHEERRGVFVGVVCTASVFDHVRVGEMRQVERRQSAVMLEDNRGLGAVVDGGVEVGNLEVEDVGPVSNLVGAAHGSDPPIPRFTDIESGGNGEGAVGDVEACVVPRGERVPVGRSKIGLCIQLDKVPC